MEWFVTLSPAFDRSDAEGHVIGLAIRCRLIVYSHPCDLLHDENLTDRPIVDSPASPLTTMIDTRPRERSRLGRAASALAFPIERAKLPLWVREQGRVLMPRERSDCLQLADAR